VTVPSLAGERALVVEDDEIMRGYLAKVLQVEAGAVRAVGDAATALAILDEFRPTVIITDLRMPGSIDGAELCRRIRRHPEFSHTPILILSGAAEASEVADIVGLGLIWYLRKGAPPGLLRKELRNLVSAAQRVRSSSQERWVPPPIRSTVRPA
jgi:DNA-binding response OmpR family regulator